MTTDNAIRSVLIVDDNPFFRRRMRDLLDDVETIGTIAEASGYNEAMLLIAEKMPDVVLLDIDMPPGKNGICLLKRIKQSSESCRVIMISNQVDDFYRSQCEQLGADYFLDKSNDFGRVPLLLSEMLS